MTAYTRDMSTTTDTKPSPHNPTELAKALPALHAYGVHLEGGLPSHPMPIYLGAQNTPTTGDEQTPSRPEAAARPGADPTPPARGPARPPQRRAPASAGPYNPAELLKALLLLLALLLGLALWLGGWQPATSSARLGWSHGTIDVIEGTDGDTGSRPLPPHDAGVLPAPDLPPMSSSLSPKMSSSLVTPPRPVELPRTFFEGSGPGGASVNPPPSGSQA